MHADILCQMADVTEKGHARKLGVSRLLKYDTCGGFFLDKADGDVKLNGVCLTGLSHSALTVGACQPAVSCL